MYDSPPQKTAVFFNESFVGARDEGGCYATNILLHFLDCKQLLIVLSNDDVGVARGTVFQEAGSWCQNQRFR